MKVRSKANNRTHELTEPEWAALVQSGNSAKYTVLKDVPAPSEVIEKLKKAATAKKDAA